MQPRMSAKEFDLFLAFVSHSQNYVEFGAGGSTYVASRHVGQSILCVDSSKDWLDKVAASCAQSRVRPNMVHVDVGPLGDWGYPRDAAARPRWPLYHETLWSVAGAAEADLYMIDGRFRVACFAQTVLRCGPDALICFHDFASRKDYHAVRDIARPIAGAEDLSVFQPRRGRQDAARALVEKYKYTPA